ncbi:hypothetical protein MHBO_000709 [Bonamia ostreae]|uniref:Uncharacterized protein n=1 Tax=Bonamia ostreae TaxID=126728 RepID=A0ABV2AGK1_9EUKA
MLHARQFFAFEKLKTGTSASAHMAHFSRYAQLLSSGCSVSAADNRSDIGVVLSRGRDALQNKVGPVRESVEFEHSQRTKLKVGNPFQTIVFALSTTFLNRSRDFSPQSSPIKSLGIPSFAVQ